MVKDSKVSRDMGKDLHVILHDINRNLASIRWNLRKIRRIEQERQEREIAANDTRRTPGETP